jgi:hypothetical protein
MNTVKVKLFHCLSGQYYQKYINFTFVQFYNYKNLKYFLWTSEL